MPPDPLSVPVGPLPDRRSLLPVPQLPGWGGIDTGNPVGPLSEGGAADFKEALDDIIKAGFGPSENTLQTLVEKLDKNPEKSGYNAKQLIEFLIPHIRTAVVEEQPDDANSPPFKLKANAAAGAIAHLFKFLQPSDVPSILSALAPPEPPKTQPDKAQVTNETISGTPADLNNASRSARGLKNVLLYAAQTKNKPLFDAIINQLQDLKIQDQSLQDRVKEAIRFGRQLLRRP